MNNTEKLLRAFIEAQGYEVQALIDRKETPISKQSGESAVVACMYGKAHGLVVNNDGGYKRGDDECYYLEPSLFVDYKVTKKIKQTKQDLIIDMAQCLFGQFGKNGVACHTIEYNGVVMEYNSELHHVRVITNEKI